MPHPTRHPEPARHPRRSYEWRRWTMAAALLGLIAASTGCAGPRPMAYSGIASSSSLRPNPDDRSGHTPLSYGGGINWRRYHRIIIDPVSVYGGPDAQFGKIPQQGQAQLARIMQDEFTARLSRVLELTERPGPATLRLHLTLTGASATPPVIGTLSHVDLAGGLYNTVQGVRGRQGMISGAVVYSVEIYDAGTGQLLRAEVSKQYSNAMNIAASFGALKSARIGIRKGAEDLARQIAGDETEIAARR